MIYQDGVEDQKVVVEKMKTMDQAAAGIAATAVVVVVVMKEVDQKEEQDCLIIEDKY